ncbi:RidA family protein [Paracandidimonas soli]|uniref:RidA family protein n=1 Tax=Paracandidimonas soli TaxID=1917182 RepID=UPI003342C888
MSNEPLIRQQTSARLSRTIRHGDMLYLSGITAADGGSDIQGQTRKVLEKLDEFLRLNGTDKTRLVSAQIWLRDIDRDFKGMNEVWDQWTPKDAAPTRAAGECRLADPAVLVEIIATAAL